MRLTAIKLAGFKSFVEPTTIKLPSNLMGVVGPNGCGKSNIIDAVRWVMGETSARQLRGESMSDVIFSGSSVRKPVTTATVELTFDNSDGRAGGEYASYSEISVRRQVSREGQSSYFLNGSRCRRKDITDLFLGTGLGPRSYAIIEQGMISQIVEARPEELRGFLEEAAGVSLYKERRRETENRIRHTRENLERLADLREEVTKQLAKLKRQASAAERYRKLKSQYREEEARLNALRWRQTRVLLEQQRADLKQTETAIEQAVARQRESERSLESLREQQHKASEQTSSIQAELYEVAGEIARLEQSIEHHKDLIKRQRDEFSEVESQINELQQHLVLDRAQVDEVTGRIGELEPALKQARDDEQQAQAHLEKAESELSEHQDRLQSMQSSGAETRQRVELLKVRIEHLDERMHQGAQRLEQLQQDDSGARQRLDQEQKDTALEIEKLEAELSGEREKFADNRRQLDDAREQIEKLKGELDERRNRRRELAGRLESLHVLNAPAGDETEVDAWLNEHGIADRPTLLESLQVDADWRDAVETVLDQWLSARVVGSALPETMPKGGGVGLIDGKEPPAEPGTLGERVGGAGSARAFLNSVLCCSSADEARVTVDRLEAHQSAITADGLWLGRGWLWRRAAGTDESAGKLSRQQEIREIESGIERLDAEIAEHESALSQVDETRVERDDALESIRRRIDTTRARLAELSGIRSGQQSRLEALERRRKAAGDEREALEARQEQDQQALAEARRNMQAALTELERNDTEERELLSERTRLQQQRESRRGSYRSSRDSREGLALKMESSRASLNSLKQAIERMDTQIGQLQGRYVELSEALAQGDQPVQAQQAERDKLLTHRLEIEQRLKQSRGVLEELEGQWRETDRRRQEAAAEAENVRNRQSESRIKVREFEIEMERYAARVSELEGDLEALARELPDDAEAQARVDELTQLEEKIRRLEPVNLAAVQEFEQESERKEYLDRQHADLVEALDTLEKAIDRIDRTTRTRFRDTFERVNQNLETLFPRLFGGGHAHLEMVGDDWLTAGAAILARPPGKRISRIHLLSGGEKALTAVAFVFSIFNLNPAPFCLLDEVDAPLDDANVGRFSELVREMSDKVQFLFVTHNKVTMEVAHQMLGVTMREPGISRLVSVDLDKAVAMAAS